MAIFASLLHEFETASDANQAFRQDLVARATQTGSLDYIARKITLDLTNILDGLQTEIEANASAVPTTGAILPLEKEHYFVIADAFSGNVMVRRYPDGGLVVVDRNFFLLMVCYVFFQSRPAPYGPKLAAWMLLHYTIVPTEPFPLIDAFYVFALRLDQRLINDLCRSVGYFFLAHELGHRYARAHGTAFIRANTFAPEEIRAHQANICNFRLHEEGAMYSVLADGRQPSILMFPPDRKRWIDELSADLFACYLHVASNPLPDQGLETLANQLCIWQQILRLLDLRQTYQDRSPSHLLSHPPSTTRMDSMVHHIEKLCQEYAPDFRSSSLSILQKQYIRTWSAAFFEAWSEAGTYVFYTIDSTALPEDIMRSLNNGERAYSPGVFRRFLEDFAVPAVRLVTKSPDHDVELAWGRQLDKFDSTCTLNNHRVLDQLAQQVRGIGLEFQDSET